MGRQESCTGLSVSQPGHRQEDAGVTSVKERTPARADLLTSGRSTDTNLTQQTHNGQPPAVPLPPDLADVVNAWPNLPDAIKAGILAMVRAFHPARCPSQPEHTTGDGPAPITPDLRKEP